MSFALVILGELLSVCPALGVSQMFSVNVECEASPANALTPQAGCAGTTHCRSPPLRTRRCLIVFHGGVPDDKKYPGDGRFREEAAFTKYTGEVKVWVKGVSLDTN